MILTTHCSLPEMNHHISRWEPLAPKPFPLAKGNSSSKQWSIAAAERENFFPPFLQDQVWYKITLFTNWYDLLGSRCQTQPGKRSCSLYTNTCQLWLTVTFSPAWKSLQVPAVESCALEKLMQDQRKGWQEHSYFETEIHETEKGHKDDLGYGATLLWRQRVGIV